MRTATVLKNILDDIYIACRIRLNEHLADMTERSACIVTERLCFVFYSGL
jgi:hypothetical protein